MALAAAANGPGLRATDVRFTADSIGIVEIGIEITGLGSDGLMRYLWLSFGLLALALGAIGSVVPLLPTTPFVLVAAYAFARSSKRLHNWLVTHATFGPLIENWQRYGAISRGAKTAGLASIIAVFSLSLIMQASTTVLAVQAVVLSGSALFIATRPTPPDEG